MRAKRFVITWRDPGFEPLHPYLHYSLWDSQAQCWVYPHLHGTKGEIRKVRRAFLKLQRNES